jgi:hypothetical protein
VSKEESTVIEVKMAKNGRTLFIRVSEFLKAFEILLNKQLTVCNRLIGFTGKKSH